MKSTGQILTTAKLFEPIFEAIENPPAEIDESAAEQVSRDAIREAWRLQRNIPQRHFQAAFTIKPADVIGTGWANALATVRSKRGSGFLIALIGPRGSGKTQICAHLLRDNLGWYCKAMDFFIQVKGSYRSGADKSEGDIIDGYIRHQLLCIDEVGERGETAWEDQKLTHLIDKRYADKRDTLLISNYNRAEFTAAIGASVSSRMSEAGGIVECNWPSYRHQGMKGRVLQPHKESFA